MKNLISLSLVLLFTVTAFAQNKKLPEIKLVDMEGKVVDLSKLDNGGKPIVISFWATWCKPCKEELNAISEEYDAWVKATGVKVIAVSIDDARSTGRVEPMVNQLGWEFLILLDPNGDLKRAMNVNNVPHTFLIDGKGNIVWEHNNYAAGDEEELLKQIKKIAK